MRVYEVGVISEMFSIPKGSFSNCLQWYSSGGIQQKRSTTQTKFLKYKLHAMIHSVNYNEMKKSA